MTSWLPRQHEKRVHELFLLNIALQLFDGVATYWGLRLGFREGNPLLLAAFSTLGVQTTLVLFKAQACAILLLLYRYRHHSLVPIALFLVAVAHIAFSLLPWSWKFLSVLACT